MAKWETAKWEDMLGADNKTPLADITNEPGPENEFMGIWVTLSDRKLSEG